MKNFIDYSKTQIKWSVVSCFYISVMILLIFSNSNITEILICSSCFFAFIFCIVYTGYVQYSEAIDESTDLLENKNDIYSQQVECEFNEILNILKEQNNIIEINIKLTSDDPSDELLEYLDSLVKN